MIGGGCGRKKECKRVQGSVEGNDTEPRGKNDKEPRTIEK